QNPEHVYNDGQWEAILIVSNACHSDTLPLTLLILTGVNDPVDDGGIVISPNPTSGEFVVILKDGIQSPFDLQIIDVKGKLVFEQRKVQPGEIIHTKNLSHGFYTVLINPGGQLLRKKLIVP
ncbi:MAG TPA: T9SS type A sorting domain-containing protein, partial [Saprospiraceae bacterium]|nr:T9SS type A sorting domain-containing protein [Saprospiraceae bacterium]